MKKINKFLCKILGHHWGHGYELRKDNTISTIAGQFPLLEQVRCCWRCKRKEFPWWDPKTGELTFGPTIADQRDIKLKKLGIK